MAPTALQAYASCSPSFMTRWLYSPVLPGFRQPDPAAKHPILHPGRLSTARWSTSDRTPATRPSARYSGPWSLPGPHSSSQSGLLHTGFGRSEEHTSELQSLMRISYAVFCLKKKNKSNTVTQTHIV